MRSPILLLAILSLSFASVPAQTPTAAPPLLKPDTKSAANAARAQLILSLDQLAAQQTAARRKTIEAIHTAAEAQARQSQVRTRMLQLIGPLPERTPLNPRILGELSVPGVRIQKLIFDSQPNFPVTALLYLPQSAQTSPLPAIVLAPGHGPTGKASDTATAQLLARNGIAVLSYDPIGQGERLQYPDPAKPGTSLATRPTGEHAEASLQPILIGESAAKYFLWDGIRAVDYLQSRPEIDPQRIGAFGCSGGGAMTALLGALDPRIAAVATACYITSFDTLLPAIGPQDGEQSTPGWIASGLDFPDWVEVVAPRPYAIIATEADMFPFAGAQTSEAEARRFYTLLHADEQLAFLTGPGGHGNLRPIMPRILQFFTDHLHPAPTPQATTDPTPTSPLKPTDLQVTSTGQVATSLPGSATVASLNLAHARQLLPATGNHHLSLTQLQAQVRDTAHVTAIPGSPAPQLLPSETPADPDHIRHRMRLETAPGTEFAAEFYRPTTPDKHPTVLILRESLDPALEPTREAEIAALLARAQAGTAVIVLAPRPSPPGTEEQKSPILGQFYLLNLRAQLAGRTLLGLRVDDVLHTIDLLAADANVDSSNITAEASGHLALVLLHAAVLDPRLRHITLTRLLPTWRQILEDPMPKDAPEDILPGVLLHYDVPDLTSALGTRLTLVQPAQ